jgi:hypothetical protein
MLMCSLLGPAASWMSFNVVRNRGSFSITWHSFTPASRMALVMPPGPGPTSMAYPPSILPVKR